MLDWGNLQRQIEEMARERESARDDRRERLQRALQEWRRFGPASDALQERVRASRTSWLLAEFREPLDRRSPAPAPPRAFIALCADGSQVFPDRHGFASCYLINIGRVAIPYGLQARPRLDAAADLYYKDEDLYHEWGGKRTLITPETLATRRALMELEALADLAQEWSARGAPVVALADGTLIFWPLESKPVDYQARVLDRLRAVLDRFLEMEVPLAGYISRPGGAEVVNTLRVGICPEKQVDCDHCPYKRPQPDGTLLSALPCEPIAGITDAQLFERALVPGERSLLFDSQSRILDDYGPHRISALYLHAGSEVARVEVPGWVAAHPHLLERLHAVLADQILKGHGYPLVLTEAHERAVLRGADRDLFYRMIERVFVGRDLSLRTSAKSASKQVPRI